MTQHCSFIMGLGDSEHGHLFEAIMRSNMLPVGMGKVTGNNTVDDKTQKQC